jgi:hypothetical protein
MNKAQKLDAAGLPIGPVGLFSSTFCRKQTTSLGRKINKEQHTETSLSGFVDSIQFSSIIASV